MAAEKKAAPKAAPKPAPKAAAKAAPKEAPKDAAKAEAKPRAKAAPAPAVAKPAPAKAPAKPTAPSAEAPAVAAPAAPAPAAPAQAAAQPAKKKAAPAKAAASDAPAPKAAAAPTTKATAAKAPAKAAPKPPAKPAPKAAPKPAPKKARPVADLDEPAEDDLDDKDAGDEVEDALDDAPPARAATAAPEAEEAPPAPKVKAPRRVPPMPPRKPGVITFAFSPDADDAFMVYALAHGKIDTEGRTYELLRADIAQLNAEAQKGTYDVTAFSFGAWPQVSERYFCLPCGASFGDQVGPVVVSKTPVRTSEINGLTIAVPGLSTTATMVLRLWLHPNRLSLVPAPFDQIAATVKAGKARAGLLIHEGQLTYKADGLTRVMDLGQWWGERTEGLPLPLGGNAIRRDIPPEERAKIALDLKRSIAYGLGHREEALDYALGFGRGLARPLLDKYVSMYVNELTLDYGERGRQAVHALYDEAVRIGILKERTDLEFP